MERAPDSVEEGATAPGSGELAGPALAPEGVACGEIASRPADCTAGAAGEAGSGVAEGAGAGTGTGTGAGATAGPGAAGAGDAAAADEVGGGATGTAGGAADGGGGGSLSPCAPPGIASGCASAVTVASTHATQAARAATPMKYLNIRPPENSPAAGRSPAD